MAAGQAESLYRSDPSSRVSIVGADSRPRWHPIWYGNPIIARPEDVTRGETITNLVVNGPNCRPYIVYPFTKETGWTFNKDFRCRDHVAKIYLTAEERARGDAALEKYGPYVLIEPHTKHENFRWPIGKWAGLVKSFQGVTFVQHVHAESERAPGAHYEQATFREVCGLLTRASAYVRSESGLCHAAAAVGCPTVTIFGGCMDAEVMGWYQHQTCIVDDGPKTPCGSWLPCAHCADVMKRLTVKRVAAALMPLLEVAHA